jgi:hypothetical protein
MLNSHNEAVVNGTNEKLAAQTKLSLYLVKNQPQIISIIFSIIGLIYMYFLLKFFNYGFEFTDEAFALFMMQRPEEYKYFHINAGFLYHPLYVLTNGHIFYLRVINFLILIGVAYNLCRVHLSMIRPDKSCFNGIYLHLTAFQLALCSTTILLIWLPTPNYNLLNYIAIMITATGVLTISKNVNCSKIHFWEGWLAIGLGGYLSFMGKPQTAIFLGILVLIWSIATKNHKDRGILIGFLTATVLMVITAYWIDGSLAGFFNRFIEAAKSESINSAHSIFKPIKFGFSVLSDNFLINYAYVVLFVLILGFGMAFYEKRHIVPALLFLFSIIVLVAFIVNYKDIFWYNILEGYLIYVPILGYISYVAWRNNWKIKILNGPIIILFIFLNVGYGMGSNNSFFTTTSLSAFFTLLALFTFFSGITTPQGFSTKVIYVTSLTLLVTIGIIVTSLGRPYRQPSLIWSYSTKASVRADDSPLYFSPIIAKYLLNLHTMAENSNLKPNTPFIDLSGRMPGTIYALSGFTPKVPWLYTGFEDNDKYEFYAIMKFTCEDLAESWIIIETNYAIKPFSPRILSYFGIYFPDDFQKAGTILLHTNFNKYNYRTTYQYVYEPVKNKDDVVSACIASKTELGLM